jgi:predicted DCC family thiol-disulfide oxidoreductase YuxK
MKTKSIIVYYEEGCPFCEWCRGFIERRNRSHQILFRNVETHEKIELFRNKEGELGTIVVEKDGKKFTKYAACVIIGRSLDAPWSRVAYILKFIPTHIGDRAYDWVAKNRPLLMRFVKFFS